VRTPTSRRTTPSSAFKTQFTSISAGTFGTDNFLWGECGQGACYQGPLYCLYTAETETIGTWTSPAPPPPPTNVDVLYCVQGVAVYKVVPPANSTSSAVRNPAAPSVVYCTLPSGKPPTWQIKVTYDKGDTWTWVTLSSLGLGN
jgi:hypothetical protein